MDINASADTEAEKTAADEIEKLKEIAQSKEKDVVKLLVDAVTKPTPKIHVNAKV